MKEALFRAALVFFTTIMLLFPSAWEPLSDAEAQQLNEES